jgi:anaerobic magnesium-protoporphyrin IX monomethyl ester cyclase
MRYALVNPNWNYDRSIYFGCREPHLPVEFGYAAQLLNRAGHEAAVIDAHLESLTPAALEDRLRSLRPDVTVITTAPTYLFWRCPPPELRIPMETCARLRDLTPLLIAVGPHASVAPASTARKLGADGVVRGEFEDALPRIPVEALSGVDTRIHEADMDALPAIGWLAKLIDLHRHHHHRFDSTPSGPGAEIESSRGCPFHCSFCARDAFRNRYRRRPLARVLEEMDRLISQGVEYFYFIDEIFFPRPELIRALRDRRIRFGIQTRIDLWSPAMLDRLGEAGCVSIEAGLESVTPEGRVSFNKRDLAANEELIGKLLHAKRTVSFVQATLLADGSDPEAVASWTDRLRQAGVWVNSPVPVFPYPGSAEYAGRWGAPDEQAWERAHAHYLKVNAGFSDLQDDQPLNLSQLEKAKRPEKGGINAL